VSIFPLYDHRFFPRMPPPLVGFGEGRLLRAMFVLNGRPATNPDPVAAPVASRAAEPKPEPKPEPKTKDRARR